MELAFSPTTPGVPVTDLVDLCVLAEEHGYGAAWAAEVAGPEAFALLGAIATRTRRIGLGVAVVPASTRSPALLAMGAATLSQAAAGRPIALGIGSSSEFIVSSWHDAPFDPPLGRVREAVVATRALLAGDSGFEGQFHRIRRFGLTSPPAGPVRLFVGALGPGMLAVAGAVADGVCLNLTPPEMIPVQRESVMAGAAATGRDLTGGFRMMARLHVVPTDDVAAGRNAIRAGFGPYFAQPVYNRFLRSLGHEEEAEAVAGAFAAGDRAGVAAALHDEVVDRVAVVGPIGAIRDRLEQYAASGLDVAALNLLAPDAAGVASALEALAPS